MSRRRAFGRVRAALGVTALVAAVGACARQGAPPGGPEDRRPPVVAAVEPDTFAIVEPGEDRIRVTFSERISERSRAGSLEEAVTISPRTGELEVSHSRSGLDIRLRGGFRPNTVYRVTIEPVIQDMFNNPMAVPFEWVFSTGPDFERNAIAGLAFDRIRGDGVDGAAIQARRIAPDGTADSLPQVAKVDQDGLFALRWLPAGEYEIVAFLDRDRDGEPEATETTGRTRVSVGMGGVPDTVRSALIPMLAPDTTPARLAQAELADSTAIRVTTDDWLNPLLPLSAIQTRVFVDQEVVDSMLAGGAPAALGEAVARARASMPSVDRVLSAADYAEYADSVAAARRAAAAAEAAANADPADSAQVAEPGPPQPARPARTPGAAEDEEEDEDLLPDGTPRPIQQFVIVLTGPLPVDIPLRLEVGGLFNVNGLGDGGGDVGLVRPAPPPPDSLEVGEAADKLALPPAALDTGAVADTGAVVDTFRIGVVPTPRRRLR